jgi:hypothetical protein
MLLIGQILAAWVLVFLCALYPARWVGPWIERISQNTLLGVVMCIVVAKLVVVLCATILVFARLSVLSHVNTDVTFAIFFTAVLFGVPVFSALVLGFRHARGRRSSALQSSH